jgi:hypothetical protein
MNYSRRIEKIEENVPQQKGETVEELLDRVGLGCLKKNIQVADSFRDVVLDQGEEVAWRL